MEAAGVFVARNTAPQKQTIDFKAVESQEGRTFIISPKKTTKNSSQSQGNANFCL